MSEKTDKKITGLKDVSILLNEKTTVRWQKAAFMQYAGYKKGKSLTQSDFDAKWAEFSKKYLGGK